MWTAKTEAFENADVENATDFRRVYPAHAQMIFIPFSSGGISVFKRFRVGGWKRCENDSGREV